MNRILLAIHVILFTVFCFFHIEILIYTNIGSILIYSTAFLYLKKNQILYLQIACIEIVVHVGAGVFCLGWEYGFQLYFFALIPMIFYADYMERKLGNRVYHPYAISISLMTWFCILKVISSVKAPLYPNESVYFGDIMFLINVFATCSFVIYFMSIYKNTIEKNENALRDYAQLDALTGLKNKSWLLQMEETYFQEQLRCKNKIFIAILDIDDFKMLNDAYGHQFGDKVLLKVAAQLKELEENNMNVCRWGGEEFLIFGNGQEEFTQILSALYELKEKVSKMKFIHQKEEIHVTITIGITKKTTETNFEALMKKADEKLYYGKRHGKNQIVS